MITSPYSLWEGGVWAQDYEWCRRPPPPTHARTYTTHMRVHTRHAHTHTHDQLCRWDFFLRSYDTQNCSLVAMPLFSFQSLLVHTARNKFKMHSTSTLYKIKGSIINRTILMFYCYFTQIKNSDLELSDVACTPTKQLQKEWTPNIILTGWSSFSVLLPHMNHTELKQRE